jgi:hypothetical protein
MSAYPCNPGTLHWSGPESGWFRPQGGLKVVDEKGVLGSLRGAKWTSTDTLAARIIVGFNVGDKPTWTVDDLIPLVRAVRIKQTGDPSASFIAQKGIYQHRDPAKGTVQENGAQVLIIDTVGLPEAQFEDQMIQLAEKITRQFQQETVILEIQRNGVTQRVHGIEP